MSIEHGCAREIEDLLLQEMRQPSLKYRHQTVWRILDEIRSRTTSKQNLFAMANDVGGRLKVQVGLCIDTNDSYRVELVGIPRHDNISISFSKVDNEGQTGDEYYIDSSVDETVIGGWSKSEGGTELKPLSVTANSFAVLVDRALNNLNSDIWRIIQ